MFFIYALVDPRTELICYVGKSKDPRWRLRDHLAECDWDGEYVYNHRKVAWLRALQMEGLIPILIVLEEITEENWQERERWWIAYCRTRGLDLLNLTKGGEGGGMLGHSHSEETKQRISKAVRGRKLLPFSEEHKRKLSEAHKGKKFSEETRLRMSKAHSNCSKETRRRISKSAKSGWIKRRALSLLQK